MWKQLHHPNVLLTLGAGRNIAESCVASPWMPDRHFFQYEYPKRCPGAAHHVSIVSIHNVYDSQYAEFNAYRMLRVLDGPPHPHFNDVVHGYLQAVGCIDYKGFIG